MKTTIDIPEKTLREAMRHTRAKTKKEVVVKALEELNRQERVKWLISKLGTFDDFMSPEELEKMRATDRF